MKKGLVIVLLFLLLFALLAVSIKVGDTDLIGGGSANKSENNVNQDQTESPGEDPGTDEQLGWIDPETGIDIFAYENVLDFEDGNYLTISLGSGDVYEDGAVSLYADESLVVPSVIMNGSLEFNVSEYTYEIDLGSYVLSPDYTYYFYYSRDVEGGWDKCGLGYEDTNDGRYDIDFCIYGSGFDSEFGCFCPSSTGEYRFAVCSGLEGRLEISECGKFYLRVIAVPNT